MLSLEATARGDWYGAIRRVRDAVYECGLVLDEHPFSGVMVSFRIELHRKNDLVDALLRNGVVLDAASAARLGDAPTAPSGETTDAALVVHFPDGDPDKRHVVPAVPG